MSKPVLICMSPHHHLNEALEGAKVAGFRPEALWCYEQVTDVDVRSDRTAQARLSGLWPTQYQAIVFHTFPALAQDDPCRPEHHFRESEWRATLQTLLLTPAFPVVNRRALKKYSSHVVDTAPLLPALRRAGWSHLESDVEYRRTAVIGFVRWEVLSEPPSLCDDIGLSPRAPAVLRAFSLMNAAGMDMLFLQFVRQQDKLVLSTASMVPPTGASAALWQRVWNAVAPVGN